MADEQVQAKRRLTAQDLLQFQMADDPQVSPDGSRVAWVRTRMDAASNSYRSELQVTDLATGATEQITDLGGQAIFPRWSPDGRWLAFLAGGGQSVTYDGPATAESVLDSGSQLMVMPAAGGTPTALTALRGGVRAPAWSPDGSRIAFLTYVRPAHGLETLEPHVATDDLFERFNRDVLVVSRLVWLSDAAGYVGDCFLQIATVGVTNGKTNGAPELVTNEAADLTPPVWSPDGRWLATSANLDADGEVVREAYIYLVDTQSDVPAKPQKLFGLEEMRSSDLAWSPDGKLLAVCGHNDPVKGHYGNQMLWLVDVPDVPSSARLDEAAAPTRGTCVTPHIDRALGDYSRNSDMRRYGGSDGPRWSPDGQHLWVLLNEAGSVDLCRFDRTTGKLTPLTSGKHSVVAFTLDNTSSTAVLLIGNDLNPGDLYLLDNPLADQPVPDADLTRLTHVNAELLDALDLVAPIRFQAESDGVIIDCWMHPPVAREPGKQYPVILYTGGGPGGMRASVFCHEFNYYAAQGYCVVHCNTRGNHGYGEAFSLATRGKWGDLDTIDNLACLRAAIAQFDFVDPSRKAVAGGSYGGYMATWIISHHPDEFQGAVVDRSLINRFTFNGDMTHLLDRVEFDKRQPWEDVDTYIERSPIHYVGQIKTPTLVVHSAMDHRCPVEQGEQLYMSLLRAGVTTEFVRFPNESHELSRGGRPWHRVFRLERYLDWFERHVA